MTLRRGPWPLARAAAAGAALCLALVGVGEPMVRAALPAVPRAMAALAPEFQVLTLQLVRHQGDRVVQMEVGLAQAVALGGRVLQPSPLGRANASTLALPPLHAPLLAAWALLVAGSGGWRPRARALLLWCPLAALLVVGDLALTLSASLWGLLLDGMAPGTSSPLLAAQALWAGGGRWVAALGLAWSVARLSALAFKRPA